jgi:hypothetical protein
MPKHHHTWWPKEGTCFIVKNIAPNDKRIRIFGCPIRNGEEKDLLNIPEISEAVIRHSLLKGELRIKGLCGEIEVTCSDIDLLQFNDDQKDFLISIGIEDGLEVPTGIAEIPFLFKQHVPLTGAKDGVNRIYTVPDKFINGPFGNNDFRILVRHNGRVLIAGCDFTITESGGPGTGFDTLTFITFTPNSDSELIADYVTEAP